MEIVKIESHLDMFQAQIRITLKDGIRDIQGEAITRTINNNKTMPNTMSTNMGKYIELELDVSSRHKALKDASSLCDKLLANPVMEKYEITIKEIK